MGYQPDKKIGIREVSQADTACRLINSLYRQNPREVVKVFWFTFRLLVDQRHQLSQNDAIAAQNIIKKIAETVYPSTLPQGPPGSRTMKQSAKKDFWIYRIVVISLASTLLSCVGGTVILQTLGHGIPETLNYLSTGSLCALAGLLTPTPNKI